MTEGQCIDAEDDGVILQAVCLEKRYNTGDYIMIQHGQSFIPAVVDHWPWVKFFTKARTKGFWSLSEVKHTVVETDVNLKLPPPDITMCGTRLLYHFPEHNQKKQKHL